MKILIVNGYGKNVAGLESFEHFKSVVREVLLGKQEMIDTEIEFYIRDRDNIDEFLYEIDSSFVRVESGKMFDSVDLIFFEGDANLRPWSPNAYKFVILLRMCMRSNKILFASSFAMQGLVFLIASNVEANINIVNGLNGSQLGDMSKIRKSLSDIRSYEYFLDNVTGDMYGFNYDSGEWISKGNVGMHYRRAAEEFKTIGKYIVKAPQYKVQRMKELDALYVQNENEIVCSVRKNNMHHYLLHNLPFEFVVPSKNSWDIHPFNFVNPKKTFQTLADCEKGPMILSITDNIVAVVFNINQKYKETVQLLKNYMGYQLTKLCSGHSYSVPIELASIKQNDNAMDVYLENMGKSKYHNKQTIKFNVITEFHHAGFACKRSNGLDVVVNNAIGQRKFKQQQQPKLTTKDLDKLLESGAFNNNDSSFPQSSVDPLPSIHATPQVEETIKEPFNKTSTEIRMLLHPSIDKSILPDSKAMWVPGFMSQSRNNMTDTVRTSKKKHITNIEDQNDPYITKEDIEREERKERRKKMLGAPHFSCNNTVKPNFVPNYVVRTPSLQFGQQQFRSTNKDKWVSYHDFLI